MCLKIKKCITLFFKKSDFYVILVFLFLFSEIPLDCMIKNLMSSRVYRLHLHFQYLCWIRLKHDPQTWNSFSLWAFPSLRPIKVTIPLAFELFEKHGWSCLCMIVMLFTVLRDGFFFCELHTRRLLWRWNIILKYIYSW